MNYVILITEQLVQNHYVQYMHEQIQSPISTKAQEVTQQGPEAEQFSAYYQPIIDTMQGEKDWGGYMAVRELIADPSSPDRDEKIRAMGQVAQQATEHPDVAADVFHIAYDLNLEGELEQAARYLAETDLTDHPQLGRQVQNYVMSRQPQE